MIYNAKNDKVLIEQTKKQGTYSFAGQKLTALFQHTLLTKAFSFNFCSTRPPPAIVRPLQVTFEQLIITELLSPKCKVLMRKPLVCFIMVEFPLTVFVFDGGKTTCPDCTTALLVENPHSLVEIPPSLVAMPLLGLFLQQYHFARLNRYT